MRYAPSASIDFWNIMIAAVTVITSAWPYTRVWINRCESGILAVAGLVDSMWKSAAYDGKHTLPRGRDGVKQAGAGRACGARW
jgi:hypothetical protein